VFLIADFGWLGLIAFAAAFVVGIRRLRRQPYVALAALAVTGSGFFLSLHAWGSSMTMWVLLLGFALWVPTNGDVNGVMKVTARRDESRAAASNDPSENAAARPL
jgi:4-hydroxybenzoate polyprenyltransferase